MGSALSHLYWWLTVDSSDDPDADCASVFLSYQPGNSVCPAILVASRCHVKTSTGTTLPVDMAEVLLIMSHPRVAAVAPTTNLLSSVSHTCYVSMSGCSGEAQVGCLYSLFDSHSRKINNVHQLRGNRVARWVALCKLEPHHLKPLCHCLWSRVRTQKIDH